MRLAMKSSSLGGSMQNIDSKARNSHSTPTKELGPASGGHGETKGKARSLLSHDLPMTGLPE
jgi:hypothetical protein